MGQKYILVETEEKRQTLQAVLQDEGKVLVVPTIAAVVEVKNVDHLARGGEGFSFKPVTACHDVLKKVLQDGQENIYLAFDQSELGEYGSWLWAGVAGQLFKGVLHCHRLQLASLDKDGLAKAMELVETIDAELAARFYFEECFTGFFATHLNRLIGTRSGPGGVPLTIPVLSILALLAQREQELKEFSAAPKWHVELSLQGSKGVFPATLKEVLGVCCDGTLENREQAKEVAGELVGQSFRVAESQENNVELAAPRPYALYDLIFDAFRYCQIPMDEAMKAAHALSVGVSFAGRRQALISSVYPIVLSNAQPLADALAPEIIDRFGKESLCRVPLAEYGIMPTNAQVGPEDLGELPEVLQKMYDLVWRRALASQMQAATGKEIILLLKTEKYQLQSDFRVIDEPGFLQVYQYGFESLLASDADIIVSEGEQVEVAQVVPEQRFDVGPDLYTLPSLAEDLEELRVERQEEIVQILGRLCATGYITAQRNGTLQCDSNLFKVVNTLNRAFPTMQGMHFVVYYAQTIDEVASGRKRFQMALKQFDQNLMIQGEPLVKIKVPTSLPKRQKKSKSIIKSDVPPLSPKKATPAGAQQEAAFVDFGQLEEVKQRKAPEVAVDTEGVDALPVSDLSVEGRPAEAVVDEGPTPVEQEDVDDSFLVEEPDGQGGEEQAFVDLDDESSLYDEVAAAEAEKLFQDAEEQLVEPAVLPDTQAQVPEGPASPAKKGGKDYGALEVETKPCPECARPMVLKGDRFGSYWACTGMPACRHTEGARQQEDDEAVLSCPLCDQGQLLVKRTPTGKDMYVCRREACEFMAWSKPHAIHCPLCSSSYLVEKKAGPGKVVLRCPKAGCNYSQGADDGAADAAPVKKKKVIVRRKKGSAGSGGKRKVVVRRRKA